MQKGRHKRKDALAEYSKALGKLLPPNCYIKNWEMVYIQN